MKKRYLLFILAILYQVSSYTQDVMPQSVEIQWNVQLIPQQTNMSCWAASAVMLVGWRDNVSLDPSNVLDYLGPQYLQNYQNNGVGYLPDDDKLFEALALTPVGWSSFGIQDLVNYLEHGPLWTRLDAGSLGSPSPHLIVITGIQTDGTPASTTLIFNNPAPVGSGRRNVTLSFQEFKTRYLRDTENQKFLWNYDGGYMMAYP